MKTFCQMHDNVEMNALKEVKNQISNRVRNHVCGQMQNQVSSQVLHQVDDYLRSVINENI